MKHIILSGLALLFTLTSHAQNFQSGDQSAPEILFFCR
jgi:hypothetical protein